MKNILKTITDSYLRWIQHNGVIKFILSIILCLIIYMISGVTKNDNFLYLYIIPGLYIVPLILTLFIYAFFIYPIMSLLKK